jgi:preprotein translocase subunit SecD
MNQQQKILLGIALVVLISIYLDLPQTTLDFNFFGRRFQRDLEIKQGLDLQGGLQVVLQAEMDNIAEDRRDTALEAARNVIERRVNFFGVTEPAIQTSKSAGQYRIVVELPGVVETEQALTLIGQTAQLDFREPIFEELPPESTTSAQIVGFQQTDLTGKDLEKAQVTFEQNTSAPQIAIKFTDEGATKFEELTTRNVGQPLAIFLDDQVISAPRVNEAIAGGEAVITGQFTLEQAKNLAIQLNAGALPVPIEVLEQRSVGATLGQNSVRKSLVAGAVGLFLVAFFMIAYYGRLGLLATAGLIIYGLITLALYKLIPVTLTLAGMAGFLLSIGMAVDANILIFEKIKEELRAERPKLAAMEAGFGRAWDSIRDANICTLITCFVLFNPLGWSFLNTSGMVRGFALTLGLGIFVSLFTGVVVTRTLIRVFYR